MTQSAILFTVGWSGLVSLSLVAWLRIGVEGMLETPLLSFQWMLWAGLWNSVAFIALTRSLRIVPLFYVNALNVSQVALAAIAGIFLFSEPSSISLIAGVVLTGIGLFTMKSRKGS